MQEKIDELYQKYLAERLDMIISVKERGYYFGHTEEEPKEDVKIVRDEEHNKYYFTDIYGQKIGNFDYVGLRWSYEYGVGIIETAEGYNFINKEGKILSDIWFYGVGRTYNGFVSVYQKDKSGNVKYNAFNLRNHQLVSPKQWYDSMEEFDSDTEYSIVKKGNWYGAINAQGEIVYPWSKDHKIMFYATRRLEKCVVKKTIAGYQCVFPNGEKINTKYLPIMTYSSRFIVCVNNKKEAFLWDRETNEYEKLCHLNHLECRDNLIIINSNGSKKVYFVYEGQVIDITKYYYEKLKDMIIVDIKKGVSIISKDDFFFKNEKYVKDLIEKEKEEDKIREEEKARKEEEQKLQEMKVKEEEEKKELIKKQKEVLYQIQKSLSVLDEIEKKTGSKQKIQVSNLFVDVSDHKEINPMYLEIGLLKFIDLSMISFKNVKIAGIDFSGCNIHLIPQEVYEKDLHGCNFEGVYIDPFMDFTGVDIRGCKFSRDKDPKTIDRGSSTFKHAIYDETTTFDGIPFTEIYGEYMKKSRAK